jgi:sugar phosphate isomerase/epimerase
MKLSVSTLGCHDYTVDQIVAAAAKYGYDGVELRMVEKTVKLWELKDFSSAAIAATKRKFTDAGLAVPVVGASTSFAAAGTAHRAAQMEDLKRWAEVAQGMGSPYVRVFGGPVPEGQTMAETLKWDIEGYNEAVPIMAAYGVTLLFETHDSFSTSAGLLPLVKGINGTTGIIWDILHPLRHGESIEDTWKGLGPYVRHVHIKDSREYSSDNFDFMLMGEGTVPVPQILSLLKTGGYEGYLCFEWERGWHPEIPSSDIAFPQYIEYMRKLL